MPHDKNGMLINVGDFVLAKPYNYSKVPVVGRVVEMREGQTCSGDFAWASPYRGMQIDAFGAGEAELVLRADGSAPAQGAPPPDITQVGSGG